MEKIIKFFKKNLIGIFIIGVFASVAGTCLYDFLMSSPTEEVSPSESGVEKLANENIKKEVLEPPQKRNYFLIQSWSTIEIYEGDLTITLKDSIRYSNQKINLVVSKTGKPQRNWEGLSLGDKVTYEGYEITYAETKGNISTCDVLLKVVLLDKNT